MIEDAEVRADPGRGLAVFARTELPPALPIVEAHPVAVVVSDDQLSQRCSYCIRKLTEPGWDCTFCGVTRLCARCAGPKRAPDRPLTAAQKKNLRKRQKARNNSADSDKRPLTVRECHAAECSALRGLHLTTNGDTGSLRLLVRLLAVRALAEKGVLAGHEPVSRAYELHHDDMVQLHQTDPSRAGQVVRTSKVSYMLISSIHVCF